MSVKVTFARPYTDWSGNNHNPDASASLDESEADHVLRMGYARPADEKPAAKKATPKPSGSASTAASGTTSTSKES